MAEQIPEVWIGREAQMFISAPGATGARHKGILEHVNERGVSIKQVEQGSRLVFYPWHAIAFISVEEDASEG